MTNHPNRWQRVGEHVVQRRMELGLHERADLIQISGVSEPTVRHLEQGEPRGDPSARVKARIAFGLRWMPDAIDQLLKGRKPEDLYDAEKRIVAAGGGAQLMQVQAEIADWEYRRRNLEPAESPSTDEITRRLDQLEVLIGELLRGQVALVEGQKNGIASLDGKVGEVLAAVRLQSEVSRRPSRRVAQ